MKPLIDASACTRCGLCAADCVGGHIDPATIVFTTDRCIGCGHCVAICPQGAVRLEGGATEHTLGPDLSAYEQMVLMRRSLRRYRPEELSREHIGRLLELARFAPTGTNSQAVDITVLASRERVRGAVAIALDLFRSLARLLNPLTLLLVRPFIGKDMAGKLAGYRRRLDEAAPGERDILAHDAPALFIFHAPRSSTPAEDALIWAHSVCLHAESLGIGTCYNGFLSRAFGLSRRFRTWIGLPKGHTVYACFTAGYPAVSYRRPAPRRPVRARILD